MTPLLLKLQKSFVFVSIFLVLQLLSESVFAQFTHGNLVVLQAGNGSAALTSASTAMFAVEYSTSGTPTGISVALPTTTVSTTPITMSGTATEGNITLSAERDQIVVSGYNAVPGVASIVSTASSTNPRELYSINSAGTASFAVSSSTAYTANNMRSGTSSGANYFSAGATASIDGIVYLNTSTQIEALAKAYVVQIFNGQLYFACQTTGDIGIVQIGTGISTASGQSTTVLTPATLATPYGFSISPDGNTLYVADNTDGILKFTRTGGSGTFSSAYTVNTITCVGMTVDFSGANPVIYATNTSGSSIIRITDVGASSSATTIAAAPTNTAFKGLTFSPSCYASVSVLGASSICSGTSKSIIFSGNPTATVNYNLNGGSTQTTTIGVNGFDTVSIGTVTTTTTVNLVSITTPACSSVSLSGGTTITVAAPGTITGTASVATAATTALSDTSIGGTWSSGSTTVATVGTTGIVTGVAVGTAIISFTSSIGCIATVTVTVNSSSGSVITGSTIVCAGSTTTLSDATTGGTWSSGATGIATVGTTGIVYGVSAGTAIITYSFSAGGTTTATIMVNPLPASITGSASVCVGLTTGLSDAISGGTWSSGTTGIATVGSVSGVVTGVSSGTTIISYTTSCGMVTQMVTVNGLPSSIGGTATVCLGATTGLSETTTGGTWTSSNTSISTVNTSGVVYGVAVGMDTVSYTLSTGCLARAAVTVNPLPNAGTIAGAVTVIIGGTTTLSDAASGGSWSSTNASVATVGSTGIVTGAGTGITTISYTVINGCGTSAATNSVSAKTLIHYWNFNSYATTYSYPATFPLGPINADYSLISTSTATIYFGTFPGTSASWHSAVTTLMDPNTSDTSDVNNQLGAYDGTSIRPRNPLDSAYLYFYIPTTGYRNIRLAYASESSSTTSGDGEQWFDYSLDSGATWNNALLSEPYDSAWPTFKLIAVSFTSDSQVNDNPRLVFRIHFKNNTSLTSGNNRFDNITVAGDVYPTPAITGVTTVCAGSTTVLSDAAAGGAWSSGSTGIATVGSSTGTVYGVSSGSASITYSYSGGGMTTTSVTVNPLPTTPASITGTVTVCTGATTGLTDGTTGGIWSSANTSTATVGSTTGIVGGVAPGTATISYGITNGCGTVAVTQVVTVNLTATAGTTAGTDTLVTGGITILTDATTGGVWSSTNTSIATAGSSTGIITAVSLGSAAISYTVSNTCGSASAIVTVSVLNPNFTRGNLVVVRIGDPGGSALSSAATVNSLEEFTTSGTPTGVILSFPVSGGGTLLTTSGSATSEGGMTMSAERDRLIVEGYNAATGTTGIASTASSTDPRELVAVNSLGGYSLGASSTTAYTGNNIRSGTASAGNYFAAGTGTASPEGIVYMNTGTQVETSTTNARIVQIFNGQIYYTSSSGSFVGVSKMGAGISTSTGQNDTLVSTSYSTSGGASPYGFSFSPSGATLYIADDGAGISKYTGSGTSYTFQYKVTDSVCRGLVVDYSGTQPVLYATNATLTNGNSIVKITDAGVGSAPYTPTVIATAPVNTAFRDLQFSPSCYASVIATSSSICGGSNDTLIISGNPTASVSYSNGTSTFTTTIAANGIDTVIVSALTTTTTFALVSMTTNACSAVSLTASATITVNTVSAITGTAVVCALATTGLTDITTGGSWSSTNTATATVSTSGLVTGLSGGTTTISYIKTYGCGTIASTQVVTVNQLPTAGTISVSGAATVCQGASLSLTDGATGGVWSSTNTAIATVGSTTGTATGVSSGTSTISYTVTNGCGNTATVAVITVNPLPNAGAITGIATVNVGNTTTLSDAVTGGAWSSTNTAIATITSSAGIISGIAAGTATISYIVTNGCGTVGTAATVTVNTITANIYLNGFEGITIVNPNCTGGATGDPNLNIAGSNWNLAVSSGTPTLTTFTGNAPTSTTSLAISTATPTTSTFTLTIPVNSGYQANVTGLQFDYRATGTSYNSIAITINGTSVYTNTALSTTSAFFTIPVTGLSSSGITGTITAVFTLSGGTHGSTGTFRFDNVSLSGNVTALCPAIITGTTVICAGASAGLSDATTGGTWSSSSTTIATVGSSSGTISGLAQGTSTITYTSTCGTTTSIVTVNPLPTAPASITGTVTVCPGGATTSLSDATTGGVWSNTNITLATVGSTGTVTGVLPGTSTISYTITNGCGSTTATAIVTVSALPNAGTIMGYETIGTADTTTLRDTATGGAWSSMNTAIATIGSTGIVGGVAAGADTVYYTVTNSCGTSNTAATVTISTPVGIYLNGFEGITIANPNCTGGATGNPNLNIAGSNWNLAVSSGTPNLVTFTGNAPTSTTSLAISTATPTTQTLTLTIPVNSGYAANINGLQFDYRATGTSYNSIAITINGTLVYTNTALSTTSAFFTIPVTGLSINDITGTITAVLTLSGGTHGSTGTFRFDNVSLTGNVNVIPSCPAIAGTGTVCVAATTTLSDATTGGAWSSGNTAIATVGSSSGIVTGVAAGMATIVYIASCGTITTTVTVNPLPSAPPSITGTVTTCAGGGTTSLNDAATGGIWSSTSTATATIASTGIVTGVSAGTAIISYTLTNGCGSTASVTTVTTLPASPPSAGTISGTSSICAASTTTLGETVTGGTWSSSNTSITTVSASGVMAGIAVGADTIIYAVSSTCGSSSAIFPVTVNVTPATPVLSPALVTLCPSSPAQMITASGLAVTWSPATGLYTNSGATSAYSGSSTGSIYVLPASTTVYSVSATVGACTSTTLLNADVNSSLYVPSIGGISGLCLGSTVTLNDSAGGGTWSSSATGVATVGSMSGIVSGVIAGNAIITYTYASGACSGSVTKTISVNALPSISAITGTINLCLTGSPSSTLTDATTGGTFSWSSGSAAVATVGSSSGVVTALSLGSSVITYTFNNGICTNATITTVNVTNNPPTTLIVTPSVASICPTGPAQLLVASGGLISGSSTFSSGTVNVNCNAAGTAFPNSITVSGVPAGAVVTGVSATINFTSSYLHDYVINLEAPNAAIINLAGQHTPSGSGSYTNTVVSSIGTTALSSGASPYSGTYSADLGNGIGGGGYASTVTSWSSLYSTPNGTWTLAPYNTYTFSDVSTLGSWSITISYNYPASITWSPIGGLYTNSGATSAYIGSATNTIYTLPSGTTTYTATSANAACTSTASANVVISTTLYVPGITGSSSVCTSVTTAMTDSAVSGVWTSSNTSAASIGSSSGIITGISAGTSVITYTLTSGSCSGFAVKTVTVNALPTVAAVSGAGTVCSGSTITLTDATSGGTWSSGNLGIVTISPIGVVSPVAVGTAAISYAFSNGTCANIVTTTVSSLNAPATVGVSPSSSAICAGGPAQLLTSTGGLIPGTVGASSGTINLACNNAGTAFPSSVTISGVPVGATISSVAVTVNFTSSYLHDYVINLKAPDASVLNLMGQHAPSGSGSYTNTVISSAASTLLSSGASPFTGTYTADFGSGIGGGGYMSTVTSWSGLYTTPNGTWTLAPYNTYTSADVSILGSWSITINYTMPPTVTWSPPTGLYTNVGTTVAYTGTALSSVYALPTATSTYSVTASNGSCASTSNATVTVNPLPAVITGGTVVCALSATTLNDATTGGTWSSGNTAVATVASATGVVTGVAAGTTIITYTLATGCITTTAISVNPLPLIITGSQGVCIGATITLSDATTGGAWSSSNTALATVGSLSGIVSGVSAGTPVIAYTLGTGCSVTSAVTINSLPSTIAGALNVCAGLTTTLSDGTTGGVWSSSNTSLATVGSVSGIVSGITNGNLVIVYRLSSTGCTANALLTVNPLPVPISGTFNLCGIGSTTTLTDSSGGVWSSSNTSIVAVGSTSGTISGVAYGTSTITYTLGTGCITTSAATVNVQPVAITGPITVCGTQTITLSDATTGGSWSSSNTSIATTGSTGVVTGGSGITTTATITYTEIVGGCSASYPVSVSSLSAIAGALSLCGGFTLTLTDATPGGIWTTGNTGIATVTSSTGIVSSVSAGATTISYSMPSGCVTSVTFSVNTTPSVFAMTGGGSYCSSPTPMIYVGLNSSNGGVSYQLFNTLTGAVGSPVIGGMLGGPFEFGAELAGTYYVVANIGLCSTVMSGFSTVTALPLPTAYAVTGGGSYCPGGTGVNVYLNNSTIGINYQLFAGSIPVGTTVPGTGAPLNFGLQTTSGTYTVFATNPLTGCMNTMSGSAVVSVFSSPVPQTVTGGGAYCTGGTGIAIGLSGSVAGTTYQLSLGGTPVGPTLTGTGSLLSFGLITAAGVYNVIATSTSTGCSATMSGTATVTIGPLPTVFTVTGGGGYCIGSATGVSVGLSGSAVGVNYQLYYTPSGGLTTAVGSPAAGTGVAITFASGTGTGGTYTNVGSYSVVATSAASPFCSINMFGSVAVFTNPLPSLFTVGGGGSYCAGGSGVPVALSGSTVGATYNLYNGLTLVGAASGTGSSITFGSFTGGGTYTVGATTTATGCATTMSGSATVTIISLPAVYTVSLSGGSSYCNTSGATGVPISLSGSNSGINYQLYNGGVLTSTVAGTGSPISFGNRLSGSYTVVAATTTTPVCTSNMTGSVSITANALPTLYSVTGGGNYCSGALPAGVHIGLSASNIGITYALTTGSSIITTTPGIGGALDFGLQAAAGVYRVTATNTTTGCTDTMPGSAIIGTNSFPIATYFVTASGGTPSGAQYCFGGTGVNIGTNSSDIGVNYQLVSGGVPVGLPIAGSTGTALNFGPQTGTGPYTVIATNASTSCSTPIIGSITVTINSLPVIVSITGGGPYCGGALGTMGSPIGLSSSASGILYQLYNGTAPIGSAMAGTGSALNFGLEPTGTYTIVATNPVTTCSANMSGSAIVTLSAAPVSTFAVTGGGAYCPGGTGVAVGLSSSSPGIYYQLTSSGLPVGGPVAGTGLALNFGLITTAGSCTVIGTNTTTGCASNMTGTVNVTISSSPVPHTVTGGGSYCPGGTGVAMGLDGSNAGTTYQLYNGSTLVLGDSITGTGSPISFGLQTATGTYTVVGNNGCIADMTGSATVGLYSLPVAYSITGGGNYCPGGAGVVVGLSSSATGVRYQLQNGAGSIGASMAGTGFSLNFGLQTASGTYTVIASSSTTGCSSSMTGSASVMINTPPTSFNVTGGGNYCYSGTGKLIGLDSSIAGTEYQLYNGLATVGSPVHGTGSSISFGLQTTAGTYTVIATNTATTCTNTMSATAIINVLPLPAVETVSTGGNYCAGTGGIDITLGSSQIGVNYQLYDGATPVGTDINGSGASLDFGMQTTAGTYTIVGTNTVACSNTMSGISTIVVDPLPVAYTVGGGGNYCAGDAGLHITLSGSNIGISYQLMNGGTPSGTSISGTGSTLDFGLHTDAGNYTIVATNTITGCANNMTGIIAISINPVPGPYTVTSSASNYCAGGVGVDVQLSGSATGIDYQLYNGSTTLGAPLAGTGYDLNFGLQTLAGTYTVKAIDPATACNSSMSSAATVVINPLPVTYTLTGGGSYCSGGTGVHVSLSSSSAGISYQLYTGSGSITIGSAVMGTGLPLDFGLQTIAGAYSVVATNLGTGCGNNMSGSAIVTVSSLPAINTVTGGGAYCAGGTGVHIGLTGSTAGISYQLYNGVSLVGGPAAGTGLPIDFGVQTTAGTYTAIAVNDVTSCNSNMAGSAVVTISSLPYAFSVTGGGNYCPGGVGVNIGLTGSAAGINYQLYNGSVPAGSAILGTGAAINFGLIIAPGTYLVIASNLTTGCTSNMSGTVSVGLNSLPVSFTVIGGGNYCAGGVGEHVGISSSTSGVNYQLFNGSGSVGFPLAGTGDPLDFGLQTTAGTYTVQATNGTTGCTNTMAGSASIGITPTVSPSVNVSTGVGDTVCAGHPVTLSTIVANGGPAPTFSWSINGSPAIGSGGIYSYLPTDGDIVSVSMTSDAICATPPTVGNSLTLSVLANGAPTISIAATPGQTVCRGTMVTFNNTNTFGGTPSFTWVVNSGSVSTTPSYSYAPANGDVIYAIMNSTYRCALESSVTSNHITMEVDDSLIPGVAINAYPGTDIGAGESVTFTALAINGGSAPSYQWFVNNVPVPGANASSYTSSNFSNGDLVTCEVFASGGCAGLTGFNSVKVTVAATGVTQVATNNSNIQLIPNPNNGNFTIKGSLGTSDDEEVSIEIADMLGQVIYKDKIMARGGNIDQKIQISSTLANGMYILNLNSASANNVFHVVIEH